MWSASDTIASSWQRTTCDLTREYGDRPSLNLPSQRSTSSAGSSGHRAWRVARNTRSSLGRYGDGSTPRAAPPGTRRARSAKRKQGGCVDHSVAIAPVREGEQDRALLSDGRDAAPGGGTRVKQPPDTRGIDARRIAANHGLKLAEHAQRRSPTIRRQRREAIDLVAAQRRGHADTMTRAADTKALPSSRGPGQRSTRQREFPRNAVAHRSRARQSGVGAQVESARPWRNGGRVGTGWSLASHRRPRQSAVDAPSNARRC
jgi:hypothetical protein